MLMSKTQPKARTGMGTMPVPLSRQGGGFFSGMFINRAKDPTEEDVYAQATTEDLKKYISERAIEYRPPNLSAYKVEDYWKSLHEQAKVTSVVSGKGGVGKSSIALGLTEFYSQNENVLLVDFDLHNRGLTSKYGRIPPNVSTVFRR